MIKKILLISAIILTLGVGANAAVSGEWRIHNTFDEYLAEIADTPEKTYILAYGQQYLPNATGNAEMYKERYPFLFVYDKAADEFRGLNSANELSDDIPVCIRYNPSGKYLFVGYSDGNIDLIYDNGAIRNIPGLHSATINNMKDFKNVTFDTASGRVYAGTSFGYIVVDDKKQQIADSRNFNEAVESIGKVGSQMVIFTGTKAYTYPAAKTVLSLSDMTEVPALNGASRLMPLSGNRMAYIKGNTLYMASIDESGNLTSPTSQGGITINSLSSTSDGYYLSTTGSAKIVHNDGQVETVGFSSDDSKSLSASWDGKEFWFGRPRKGLAAMKRDGSGWTLTHDNMMPNAPNQLFMTHMGYSSKYGLLTVNYGQCWIFRDSSTPSSILVSSYQNSEWTSHGLPYTNPTYQNIVRHPRGLAVDPDNQSMLYFGSFAEGMVRINLDDPSDVQHYSSGSSNLPGFHNIISDQARFGPPEFDASGNLWVARQRVHDPEDSPSLWVWPAAAKRNNNTDGWVKLVLPELGNGNYPNVFPMKSQSNKNIVIVRRGNVGAPIYIYDHNGTLENTSDDRVASMIDLYDQDGGSVPKMQIYDCYEEMETGLVWMTTDNGIFTFYPQEAMTNPSSVRRVKVSRNDGTNLADYLLAGSVVYSMTSDSRGHKWFATSTGGVLETTADGTRILNEFTAENSGLPSNCVYVVFYNPDNNSIMMSTGAGVTEYFIPGGGKSENPDNVRIYPNPVRPDYYGWINIEGVNDNSLIKIVDSAGNMVKELGRAENGSIQWDGTNHQQKRVRSGVYYVMSSGSNGDGTNNVGKIVVVN